jgi:hypothetical protein
LTISAAAAAISIAGPASATNIHFFCTGDTTCATDNNSSQFAGNSKGGPPTFAVDAAGGPVTGDLTIDLLVPTNLVSLSGAESEVFKLTSSTLGPNNTTSGSGTLALVSKTPWSSGQLDAFLGISANPTNSIGNYTGNDPHDSKGVPSAFYVFQTTFSNTKVSDESQGANGKPTFSFAEGSGLSEPGVGDFILGFLSYTTTKGKNTTTNVVGTPNSETLVVDSACTDTDLCGGVTTRSVPPVPEPSSMALLCAGILGLGASAARRRR